MNLNLIEQFLEYLEKNLNRSPKTLKVYRADLISFFAIRELGKISTQELDQYVRDLTDKNYQIPSILRKMASIRGFLKWAYKNEYIVKNPSDEFLSPKDKREKLPQYLSYYEMNLILETLQKDITWEGIRDLAIFELMYADGLRMMELLGVKFADIDLSQKRIQIFGKGETARILPFGEQAEESLLKWYEVRNGIFKGTTIFPNQEYVFINHLGHPLNEQYLTRIIKKRAKQSIGREINTHLIRHTTGAHAYMRSGDVQFVKDLLRHKSIVTTLIYTKLSNEDFLKKYNDNHPRAKN